MMHTFAAYCPDVQRKEVGLLYMYTLFFHRSFNSLYVAIVHEPDTKKMAAVTISA